MYKLIRPLLFCFDAEIMHYRFISLARAVQKHSLLLWMMKKLFSYEQLEYNPLGLAAGFDKNAKILPFMEALGFGHLEIGSITLNGSKGNSKPRIIRKENTLINNCGLDNDSAQFIYRNLKHNMCTIPVGVNISLHPYNDIHALQYMYNLFSPITEHITLNISCPNVENTDIDILENLSEVKKDVPIYIKLPPEINKLDALVSAAQDADGFVLTNTMKTEEGGLSGQSLKNCATECIRYVYAITEGKYPIIGVGGINSPESAYEKIKAGASMVQLYTGLIYEGPFLIQRIKNGLVKLLKKDGFNNIKDAVGADV